MPAIKLKKVTAEYLAEKEREAEKNKRNLEDVADEEDSQEEAEEEEEEAKPYNFLDVQVLWDKRKRTIPDVEQKLIEWLDSNLERRVDVYLPLQTLYNFYSEVCQMRGSQVADIPLFNRYIKDKFGKFFGFQEDSPYRVLIKERKQKEKTKVQGETLQIKIRDIITEVINDAGNPRKGVRFPVISKAIITKYPAQRVDIYPKKLKSALERGITYGHVELVRGVGMCGYYRLPGEPTKEEEEDKKEKKGDGEEGAENGAVSSEEGKSEEEGEKSAKDEGKEGTQEDKEEPAPKKAKKKSNKKKKKPSESVYRSSAARHSDPLRVEDVFPLAITYQSDPKEASGNKISRYIAKFYRKEVNTEKLKKALEAGVEKGMWEQTKGSGIQGSFHLLEDSFKPGYSDALTDQIAQALVACHEPKQASASMIKKYINQYHPKLNVEARPYLFKNALERACSKGTLRQLSGIGASGTFQLVEQFHPSPAILAGESSDEVEEEEEDDEEVYEKPEYIPRPTKRGRKASITKSRPSSTSQSRSGKAQPKAQAKGKSKAKPASGRKNANPDDEVEDEPVEYKPTASKSRGGAASAKTKSKPAASTKKPAKKSAKGAKGKNAKNDKKQNAKASLDQKSPARSARKKSEPNYADSDSENEIMPEYTPTASKSRGGGRSPARAEASPAKSGKSTKRKLAVDLDTDFGQDDYVPKPTKSGRGGNKAPSASDDTGTPGESPAKKRRR